MPVPPELESRLNLEQHTGPVVPEFYVSKETNAPDEQLRETVPVDSPVRYFLHPERKPIETSMQTKLPSIRQLDF